MAKSLSKEIIKSIETHLLDSRSKRAILDVYRTAEAIQLQNPAANVALEDIIEHMIRNGGSNFAVEFAPEWATRKVPPRVNGSHPEFMMVADEAYNS